jgi:hypothetical protein
VHGEGHEYGHNRAFQAFVLFVAASAHTLASYSYSISISLAPFRQAALLRSLVFGAIDELIAVTTHMLRYTSCRHVAASLFACCLLVCHWFV